MKRFGLTQSEMKLAERLLAGRSLKQCAAELSIAYETARTTLKAIFQKTGTRRQAELVLLMLRLPPQKEEI